MKKQIIFVILLWINICKGRIALTKSQLYLILECAVRLTEYGAEIYRVEESITRMCSAYGCVRVHSYATPSNIIVSGENPQGEVLTQTRRVQKSGTDIEKLHALNDLVRKVCSKEITDKRFSDELERIDKIGRFPMIIEILFYGIIAGAFCLFFGGRQVNEVLFAFLIGAVVGVISKLLEKVNANKMFARFLCSTVASLGAFLLLRLGLVVTVDNIIIGNIMTLIPGIGLTNSLRDLFMGDTVTGVLRSIEAILLATSIALGYFAAAFLLGGLYI